MDSCDGYRQVQEYTDSGAYMIHGRAQMLRFTSNQIQRRIIIISLLYNISTIHGNRVPNTSGVIEYQRTRTLRPRRRQWLPRHHPKDRVQRAGDHGDPVGGLL